MDCGNAAYCVNNSGGGDGVQLGTTYIVVGGRIRRCGGVDTPVLVWRATGVWLSARHEVIGIWDGSLGSDH